MGRRPCCCKEGLNRGAWTDVEDKILRDYIKIHGEGKWRNVPTRAGLKRCGKSCRLRWLNYLRPDIKRGNITRDEEDLIIRLHKLLGNRWSLIAGRLPGRTDNEIKNYWNTNISKKIHCHPSKPKNQSKQKPNPTTQQSAGQPQPPSPSTKLHEVRAKASRCAKVFITSDPQKSQQLDTPPSAAGTSTVMEFDHDHPETKVGPEPIDGIPIFSPKEDDPSDFMLVDIEIDEKFLFDVLNSEFPPLCDYDDGLVQTQTNANSNDTSYSSLDCNETYLFSQEMLQGLDFQPMSSLLDPRIDWLHD
ncbi:hypothetical protein F0562_024189 [Nyssa sinensis]|uniref:Myb-related protein 123 n=1 Tax=Nyssa sinensis TaxID=561372 RepID=A0A5J5BC65_9ASTE|nr:hypothetical protein F0562_024189 [Nyssa sinensis]